MGLEEDVFSMMTLEKKGNKGIYLDGDHLVLNYCEHAYDIHVDRLKRPEDIIGWIDHLADKNWMTMERLKYFIHACKIINNTDYRCG